MKLQLQLQLQLKQLKDNSAINIASISPSRL